MTGLAYLEHLRNYMKEKNTPLSAQIQVLTHWLKEMDHGNNLNNLEYVACRDFIKKISNGN